MALTIRVIGVSASVVASAWQFASGGAFGGAFFALLAIVGLVSLLPSSGRISRRWETWGGTPKGAVALRAGAIGLVALFLGVTQVTGYGLRRDIGAGILGLSAALVFIAVTIDAVFFADRRRERERSERIDQDAWLRRIAPPRQRPSDST